MDFSVGSFNLSAGSIINYVRSNVVDIDTHIHGYASLHNGDVTLSMWGQLGTGPRIDYTTQAYSDPDLLAKDVAKQIVKTFDPFTFASFTFTEERAAGDVQHNNSLKEISELLDNSKMPDLPADDQAWLMNLWGLILYEQSNYGGAAEEFNEIIRNSPPYALPVSMPFLTKLMYVVDPRVLELAYANRGDALRQLGEAAKALESYHKSGLWTDKFGAIDRKQSEVSGTQESLSDLTEKIGKSPDDSSLYFDRARVRAALGDLPGAQSDFQAANNLAHGDIDLLVAEAKFCNENGYTNLSLQLIGSPPPTSGSKADRVDVWYELAITYKTVGKADLESSATMRAIDLLDPDRRRGRY